MFRRYNSFILMALLAFGLAGLCWGQDYRATITGTVTDPSKAVIPGAKVTVRDLDTNQTIAVQTNSAGVYVVPYLTPGQKLEVSAEAPGFKKMTYPPVVLTVSQKQTADFILQVGSAAQEVTVNSESYQVGLDTEKHGSAYEFAKRGFKDANSWENNLCGSKPPRSHGDQYGFEVSGPVYIPWLYNGHD